MIFKITPRLNLVIGIAAILLLIAEFLKTVLRFSGMSPVKPSFIIICLVAEAIFLVTTMYIIAVLKFFGEEEMIGTSFLVFILIDLFLTVISLFLLNIKAEDTLVIYSLMSFISLLASVYIFAMCFFIRQRIIFGPVLMFTISMFALVLLGDLVTFILPLFNQLFFNNLIGPIPMREILSSVTAITILLPIAIMWLINRVNGFIRSQQESDV